MASPDNAAPPVVHCGHAGHRTVLSAGSGGHAAGHRLRHVHLMAAGAYLQVWGCSMCFQLVAAALLAVKPPLHSMIAVADTHMPDHPVQALPLHSTRSEAVSLHHVLNDCSGASHVSMSHSGSA